jgi:hypothetical protein
MLDGTRIAPAVDLGPDLLRRKRSDDTRPLADADATRPEAFDPVQPPEQCSGAVPRPPAQLAEGDSVSVSSEEHYLEALKELRGTDRHGAEVTATLVSNELGHPWVSRLVAAAGDDGDHRHWRVWARWRR